MQMLQSKQSLLHHLPPLGLPLRFMSKRKGGRGVQEPQVPQAILPAVQANRHHRRRRRRYHHPNKTPTIPP